MGCTIIAMLNEYAVGNKLVNESAYNEKDEVSKNGDDGSRLKQNLYECQLLYEAIRICDS